MIWNLNTNWLLIAIAIVSLIAYVLGYVLDRIMNEDGFGTFGNALIIAGGFFLSIFLANTYGIHLSNINLAISAGLAGAFGLLATLSIAKAVLKRI